MRAQVELPTLGIAFVLVLAALLLGLAAATTALSSAERSAVERQTAVSISEQLVSEESVMSVRENVIDAETIDDLNASTLQEMVAVDSDRDIRIDLEGRTLVDTTDVTRTDGVTVERVVLFENRTIEQLDVDFTDTRSATLPRRSYNTTLRIDPPGETTVRMVTANERPILKNESGLTGTFDIEVSPLETSTLWFEAAGPLSSEDVTIEFEAPRTRKAILSVTVYE